MEHGQSTAPIPLVPFGITLCGVLVMLGAFGAWIDTPLITFSGMDIRNVAGRGRIGIGNDGLLALLAGLLTAVCGGLRMIQPGQRWWIVFVLLASSATGVLLGVYDWLDIGRELDGEVVSIGWGLQLITIAGGLGLVLSVVETFLEAYRED